MFLILLPIKLYTGCLVQIEWCLLLGGFKYTISIGRAIGDIVRCIEDVCLLESPLLEVSLYDSDHR